MEKLTVILQTIKGKEKTRSEYPNWHEAMTDGSFIKLEDCGVTVAIFSKGGEFDFD